METTPKKYQGYVFNDTQQFTDFVVRKPFNKINVDRDLSQSFIEGFNNEKNIVDKKKSYVFLDNQQFTTYCYRDKNEKSCYK